MYYDPNEITETLRVMREIDDPMDVASLISLLEMAKENMPETPVVKSISGSLMRSDDVPFMAWEIVLRNR